MGMIECRTERQQEKIWPDTCDNVLSVSLLVPYILQQYYHLRLLYHYRQLRPDFIFFSH